MNLKVNCLYCENHGGARAFTPCPVCGVISDSDDIDLCHICGKPLAVIPPEDKTYCYTCGELTVNLPL